MLRCCLLSALLATAITVNSLQLLPHTLVPPVCENCHGVLTPPSIATRDLLNIIGKRDTETELLDDGVDDRSRQLTESFDRMLKFISAVGEVESYITDRAKSFIRTVNRVIDDGVSDDHHCPTCI